MASSKDFLLINSTDNVSAGLSHSECIIHLAQSVKVKKQIKLLHFSVANTFYNINSTNNHFVCNATTLTVPVGVYTSASLLTAINTLLATVSASITITLSSSTYRHTIAHSGLTTFTLTFDSTSIMDVLGFTQGSYTGTYTYTSETPINLAPDVFYIKLTHIHSSPNTMISGTASAPSFVIPINVNPPDVIFYDANAMYDQFIACSGDINELIINLYDKNMKPLQNVGEWVMHLQLL